MAFHPDLAKRITQELNGPLRYQRRNLTQPILKIDFTRRKRNIEVRLPQFQFPLR